MGDLKKMKTQVKKIQKLELSFFITKYAATKQKE